MVKHKMCEILIIGGGITGLTIARELLMRGVEDILVVEKEAYLGAHASGRNSGVLHAGIYYTPDSLRARFCVEGNHLMKEFCRGNGLKLNETGKVIVAKDSDQLTDLNELSRRATINGVNCNIIDKKELSYIEPFASTHEKALYSPDTAVIDPVEVLIALGDEIEDSGSAKVLYSTSFIRPKDDHTALTSAGPIEFKRFINASGAYADRVAARFGLGHEYKILPFKGTYKRLKEKRSHLVRANIYPVPDLRNTFLGVHFTRSVDGNVYAGPTAIPAFGRENYRFFDDISLETFSIIFRDGILLFENESFRNTALSEVRKYSKGFFFKEAKSLINDLKINDLDDTDKVGIRPQLVHWPTRKLVTDFLLIKDGSTLHILNAISPAFTSSMAFAKYAVDKFFE